MAQEEEPLMSDRDPSCRVSGHVYLAPRKRGDVWNVKYRLPDGKQVHRKLGPAWTERGRPPAGYYTRKTAGVALQAILTDARRGTLPGTRLPDVSFQEAADEYLRFVGEVRQID